MERIKQTLRQAVEDGSIPVKTERMARRMEGILTKTDQDISTVRVQNLYERLVRGDAVPQSKRRQIYGDLTHFTSKSFFEIQLEVKRVENAFNELPAEFRLKMGNQPGRVIDWLTHEENYEEAVKLGLLDPEKVKARREKKAAEKAAEEAAFEKKVEKVVEKTTKVKETNQ